MTVAVDPTVLADLLVAESNARSLLDPDEHPSEAVLTAWVALSTDADGTADRTLARVAAIDPDDAARIRGGIADLFHRNGGQIPAAPSKGGTP